MKIQNLNEEICLKIRVASINEKMRENYLRQYGHVQMRAINEPLRKCDLILIEGKKKTDKEMPKIILVKVIKKKFMSISSGGAMLGRGRPKPP